MPGRPAPWVRTTAITGSAIALLLTTGCGGLFPSAMRIVMQVGARVVVAEGVDHVRRILADEKPGSRPTVTIKHSDGSQPTQVYEMAAADSIKVPVIKGDMRLAGDGRNATVTLSPGTTATSRKWPESRSLARGTSDCPLHGDVFRRCSP